MCSYNVSAQASKLADSDELHGVLDDHTKHDELNYQVVFGCSTFTIEVSFSSTHIYSMFSFYQSRYPSVSQCKPF
jgi:hypothetical protein